MGRFVIFNLKSIGPIYGAVLIFQRFTSHFNRIIIEQATTDTHSAAFVSGTQFRVCVRCSSSVLLCHLSLVQQFFFPLFLLLLRIERLYKRVTIELLMTK